MAFDLNVLESVYNLMVNLMYLILKFLTPHNWIFGGETRKNLEKLRELNSTEIQEIVGFQWSLNEMYLKLCLILWWIKFI